MNRHTSTPQKKQMEAETVEELVAYDFVQRMPVEEAYTVLVQLYTATDVPLETRNDNILGLLLIICTQWGLDGPAGIGRMRRLKYLLETHFSSRVGCKYFYLFSTPEHYGCDLRDMLYSRGGIPRAGALPLLTLFSGVAESVTRPAAGSTAHPAPVWHILTDIDDTLYPNTEHGTYVAGSDVAWPQKQPYPGIVSFYRAFCRRRDAEHGPPRYATVLSATPGVLKSSKIRSEVLARVLGPHYGFMQGSDRKRDIVMGVKQNVLTLFEMRKKRIQTASVGTSTGTATATNTRAPVEVNALFQKYGETKFQRFLQYKSIFPEFRCIFIGDNGQGDVVAGLNMLARDPRCIVCIRSVCHNGKRYSSFRLPLVHEIPEEAMFTTSASADSIGAGAGTGAGTGAGAVKKKIKVTRQMRKRLYPFRTYIDLAQIFLRLHIFEHEDVAMVKAEALAAVNDPQNSSFKHLYSLEEGNYVEWLNIQRLHMYT